MPEAEPAGERPDERRLTAKIVAMLPEAREEALRVLAFVDAILKLPVGE